MEQQLKYYSIDRFEGDFAVCEDDNGIFLNIPRDKIPADAREGDVIQMLLDGNYTVDPKETDRRRQIAIALQRSLFHKDE